MVLSVLFGLHTRFIFQMECWERLLEIQNFDFRRFRCQVLKPLMLGSQLNLLLMMERMLCFLLSEDIRFIIHNLLILSSVLVLTFTNHLQKISFYIFFSITAKVVLHDIEARVSIFPEKNFQFGNGMIRKFVA